MRHGFHCNSTRFIGLIGLVFVPLVISSCTNSSPTSSNGSAGSLSDPSIKPAVIFTLPANGAVGPFNVYNPADGSARPSFVVQFNKLMSTYSLTNGTITCTGFSTPVVVVLHTSTTPIIVAGNKPVNPSGGNVTRADAAGRSGIDKASAYSDVLEFNIVDSSGYVYNGQIPKTYLVGHKYTITIDTSLEDINGNHLQTPYTFSFTPEPDFRIIETIPANGTGNVVAGNGATWNVFFNSPLNAGALSLIDISPNPGGEWVFGYDSMNVYFTPQAAPKFNQAYTITVHAGVADSYGHQLPNSYSAAFTTAPFTVLSSNPSNENSNVSVLAPLFFNMTGPTDTSTVRSSLTTNPPAPGSFDFYSYTPYSFYFTPTVGLQYGTKYTVTLSTGLKAADGTAMAHPYTFSFTTQRFQVNSTVPSNGAYTVSTTQPLYVYFAGPIDTSSVARSFSISPAVAGHFDYNGTSSFVFVPTTAYAPGTTYQVTISTALKASDGTPLGSPYTFTFSTQALPPSHASP